jgi:hypothetical protein
MPATPLHRHKCEFLRNETCTRCGGSGTYSSIGVCFLCGGSGTCAIYSKLTKQQLADNGAFEKAAEAEIEAAFQVRQAARRAARAARQS